jgi:hypothetical protein
MAAQPEENNNNNNNTLGHFHYEQQIYAFFSQIIQRNQTSLV